MVPSITALLAAPSIVRTCAKCDFTVLYPQARDTSYVNFLYEAHAQDCGGDGHRSDIPMESPLSPSEYLIDDASTPVGVSTPPSFTTMATLDDIEFGLDDSDIESNTPTVIDDTPSSPIPTEALSVLSLKNPRSLKQPTTNQRALKQRARTPNPNRTSEEDRIRDFLMDPFVGELEPTRVKCAICEKWFCNTSKKEAGVTVYFRYYDSNWKRHREGCIKKKQYAAKVEYMRHVKQCGKRYIFESP